MGEQILARVDTDGNNEIDFRDFLIACVNYKNPECFLNYMENAYNTFFNNENEAADAQEMIDLFCSEKDIDNKFVKAIMRQIDSDNSNTITAAEFFEAMVINLNLSEDEDSGMCGLITNLRFKKKLNINQSGTFTQFDFTNPNGKITKKA